MKEVPASLRLWFVVHFLADLLFALPLIFAPSATLRLLGWMTIDPVATRLVGAALFGIGTMSFIARNAGKETYRHMLSLKILWSGAAILGFVISLVQGAPVATGLFLLIFVFFFVLWTNYRIRLAL